VRFSTICLSDKVLVATTISIPTRAMKNSSPGVRSGQPAVLIACLCDVMF
jgi:hypothetical protein